jgi:hypothetical protein
MMQDFAITLEARNPERHHYRSYTVSAGRDLFGTWLVQVRYGRIGCAGTVVSYAADTEETARKLVRQCLARRRSAPKRIGVPYEITDSTQAGNWLS